MKILVYVGHPAQYHFFKNIILKLKSRGHVVKILIKSKDILENLVKEDGLDVLNILPEGRGESKHSMLNAMLKRDIRVYKVAKDFEPDLLIGSDTSITHVARLINKPGLTVGEDDYKIVKKLSFLLMPFSKYVISPVSCDLGIFNYKKISYQGYMKLSYLHPNVFSPTDTGIDIYTQSKFCIIRLAKLNAHHDTNIKGLAEKDVLKIIEILNTKNIKVYIDSEYPLSLSLKGFLIQIPKNRMHDLLSYAAMIITDSQSMSVEAAMLGVPSIRFNDFVGKIGVLNELEQVYGLTFGIKSTDSEKLFKTIDDLLRKEDIKQEFQMRRQHMLSDKIDVAAFFVWFIENYPQSVRIMKENPEYQNRFK